MRVSISAAAVLPPHTAQRMRHQAPAGRESRRPAASARPQPCRSGDRKVDTRFPRQTRDAARASHPLAPVDHRRMLRRRVDSFSSQRHDRSPGSFSFSSRGARTVLAVHTPRLQLLRSNGRS
jgi:hypothetical protein